MEVDIRECMTVTMCWIADTSDLESVVIVMVPVAAVVVVVALFYSMTKQTVHIKKHRSETINSINKNDKRIKMIHLFYH